MKVDVWAARVNPVRNGEDYMVSTPHPVLGSVSEAWEKEAKGAVLS